MNSSTAALRALAGSVVVLMGLYAAFLLATTPTAADVDGVKVSCGPPVARTVSNVDENSSLLVVGSPEDAELQSICVAQSKRSSWAALGLLLTSPIAGFMVGVRQRREASGVGPVREAAR